MKIVKKDKQAEAQDRCAISNVATKKLAKAASRYDHTYYEEEHGKLAWRIRLRDTDENRKLAAASLIAKQISYGWRARKSLLQWVSEQSRKYLGFSLTDLRRLGILDDATIAAKKGVETKKRNELEKATLDLLVQLPIRELEKAIAAASAANLQRRYQTKMSDKEQEKLYGVTAYSDIAERKVEVTKRELSNWARTKANAEAVKERKAWVKKYKNRPKKGKFLQTMSDYVKGIKQMGQYVEQGMTKRRKWMTAVEERTGVRQSLHNSG